MYRKSKSSVYIFVTYTGIGIKVIRFLVQKFVISYLELVEVLVCIFPKSETLYKFRIVSRIH